jgi:protein-arginine kinase activator protein McsA
VEQVKKTNLVGCGNCYATLAHAVAPMIKKMQSNRLHTGKIPYEIPTEQTKKRVLELTTLAKRCRVDGDFDGVYEYEKQIARLLEGQKEEFVWDNHHLSKQS